MTAHFQTGADVLSDWREAMMTGKKPILYPIADGFEQIEIGPGLVMLLGGAPGSGQTALITQFVVDALRSTPELKALIANVEMGPPVLLDRQLSRLSGINLTKIRHREFDEKHADRLDQAMHTLEFVADRLCFLRPPFTLDNVAAAADEFEADSLVLDYVQRFEPPGQHVDRRRAVDSSMSYLRQFAELGVAVVVVAALARSKNKKGQSSYDADGLGLASFRESSELEFGADSAFLLINDPKDESNVILRCVKNRFGETGDIPLTFDRAHQRFTPSNDEPTPDKPASGKLQTALTDLWKHSKPAGDGDECDGDE